MPRIDSGIIDLCIETAELGGDISLKNQDKVSRNTKQDGSIVTRIDKAVEKEIKEILNEQSEYSILGEEFGGNVDNEDSYWIIDPIDGTHNYSVGHPTFATSVALVINNTPFACAVNFPHLNNTLYAQKNKGAYLNDSIITVTNNTYNDYNLIGLTGKNRNELYGSLSNKFGNIQITGSAVYDSCCVSAGWIDGLLFSDLMPWDIASGVILTREAGGKVENLHTGSTDWGDVSNNGFFWNGDEEIKNMVKQSLNKDELKKV